MHVDCDNTVKPKMGEKFSFYLRICRRCLKSYKTSHKHSDFCSECYKPRGYPFVQLVLAQRNTEKQMVMP